MNFLQTWKIKIIPPQRPEVTNFTAAQQSPHLRQFWRIFFSPFLRLYLVTEESKNQQFARINVKMSSGIHGARQRNFRYLLVRAIYERRIRIGESNEKQEKTGSMRNMKLPRIQRLVRPLVVNWCARFPNYSSIILLLTSRFRSSTANRRGPRFSLIPSISSSLPWNSGFAIECRFFLGSHGKFSLCASRDSYRSNTFYLKIE